MGIYFAEHFKRQLKKLMKKYPHVKEDLLEALGHLDLKDGVAIGGNVFKIRIRSTDMKRGKSGGFRAYIYAYYQNNILAPLCIYAKSSLELISEQELKYHSDKVLEEVLEMKR